MSKNKDSCKFKIFKNSLWLSFSFLSMMLGSILSVLFSLSLFLMMIRIGSNRDQPEKQND